MGEEGESSNHIITNIIIDGREKNCVELLECGL